MYSWEVYRKVLDRQVVENTGLYNAQVHSRRSPYSINVSFVIPFVIGRRNLYAKEEEDQRQATVAFGLLLALCASATSIQKKLALKNLPAFYVDDADGK